MAAIEVRKSKDGKTSYRVKIRLKGYRPEEATFDRKKEAQRWITQTEAAMMEGRFYKSAERRKLTVVDVIDRYSTDTLPHKSTNMQKRQSSQLLYWRQQIGHMLLCDLTPQNLSKQRDHLFATPLANGNSRSAASVNRHLAALSHMLTIACEEWGDIDANPLLKVRNLSEPRGRTRFLSEVEIDDLNAACKKSDYPDLHCIVVLALSTGARRSELMNLQWVPNRTKGSG